MTLSIEEKKSLSRYRLEKAERLLDDSSLLLKEGRWESSINRSYHAALSAAKAVLILFGIDPKTQECVKTMVNKKLIIEGLLPKEHGKWFRSLLFVREDADYADYVTIDSSDAEEAYKNASGFVEKIKEVINLLIQQL
jgi:uncharacterized protein (UPF0332 family)